MSYYHVYSVKHDDYFYRFSRKHLGRIVHGLCFSWVSDSSISCTRIASIIQYTFKISFPYRFNTCCPNTLFVSRLEQIHVRQNEEREQKLKQWEIWIIRITQLEKKCQEKLKDLKSKREPKDKKGLEDQIILAKVGLAKFYVVPFLLLYLKE